MGNYGPKSVNDLLRVTQGLENKSTGRCWETFSGVSLSAIT